MNGIVNMYMQRLDYSGAYDFQKSEILAGRLRQGWGPEGADLNGGFESFREAGKNAGWEESDAWFSRKYNNLCLMLEMKPGDIVVVPKLNINTPIGDWENDDGAWARTFTLLEVTEGYRFEAVPVPMWEGLKEFGHIIGVKIVGSWSYYQSDLAAIVSEAFKVPYHWNSESRITSDVVKGAVRELAAHHEDSAGNEAVKLVRSSVEKCTPGQLNKLITQLFVEGGFGVKDAGSLTFSVIPSYSLVGDIALSVWGKLSTVKVYTSEAEWQADAVNIVIDIEGKFRDEALQAARRRGITLLRMDAREFAEMLVKYRVILSE